MGRYSSLGNQIGAWKRKLTVVTPEGHWRFIGKRNFGYGIVRINYRYERIHRISAHYFLGMDLKNPELQANHKLTCPYKDCWNPDCLYIGTQGQNIMDSWVSTRRAI